MMMRQTRSLAGSVAVAAMFFAGCATEVSAPAAGATEEPRVVTQGEASDLMFKYRQQAMELRDMAKRMEVEANWYGGRFGQSDERAQESREKASQLWMAAQEAEQLAHEYGRQVPHGQVF